MRTYAIEGNVVDRVSNKNGKGWCEDVSPTLNTQDRHAVCFQPCGDVVISLEGNGARPSHMGKGYSEDGKMYTLNTIEQHSVCYSVDCRNLYMNEEVSGTLQAKNVGGFSYNYLNPVVYAVENHPNDSRVRIDPDGIVQTLSSRMGTGGNNTPFVLIESPEENGSFVINSSGDGIAAPLDASYYKGQGLRQGIEREYVMMAYMAGNGQLDQVQLTDVSRTLDCMHDQKMVLIDKREECMENDNKKYVLRRLTPTECARLQGFPDWWCDGANGSDSAQYKLWGNGIALPCVAFIMSNIVEDDKRG